MNEILQMSNADYHGDTSRISKSGLDLIGRSPLHYHKRYLSEDAEKEAEESTALILGTALHTAVLEPERWAAEYVISPDFNRRTNEGKKQYLDFLNATGGLCVLKAEEHALIERMRDAVLAHDIAAQLLHGAEVEGTVYFDFPTDNLPWNEGERPDGMAATVPCKLRFDGRHSSGTALLDIKSTEDARPEAFFKSVANYQYHKQGAFYLDGFAYAGLPVPEKFILIAVEKKPPFAVGVYYLPEEAIEVGRGAYLENLKAYALALHSGAWVGYTPEKILPVQLPGWALTK